MFMTIETRSSKISLWAERATYTFVSVATPPNCAKRFYEDNPFLARYHIVRQVAWAMENVRKNEQKRLSEKFRKYFKRSKSILNKPLKKLTTEDKTALSLMFEIAPRLACAYRLKNFFMLVMHSDPGDASQLLSKGLLLAEHYKLKEFDACIKVYHNWTPEIRNAICSPWSNGFTEGCK